MRNKLVVGEECKVSPVTLLKLEVRLAQSPFDIVVPKDNGRVAYPKFKIVTLVGTSLERSVLEPMTSAKSYILRTYKGAVVQDGRHRDTYSQFSVCGNGVLSFFYGVPDKGEEYHDVSLLLVSDLSASRHKPLSVRLGIPVDEIRVEEFGQASR